MNIGEYTQGELFRQLKRLKLMEDPEKAAPYMVQIAEWAGSLSAAGVLIQQQEDVFRLILDSLIFDYEEKILVPVLEAAWDTGLEKPTNIERLRARTAVAWQDTLLRTKEKQVKGTLGNLIEIFTNDPAWEKVLIYDSFKKRVCIDRKPPLTADVRRMHDISEFKSEISSDRSALDEDTSLVIEDDPLYPEYTHFPIGHPAVVGWCAQWLQRNWRVEAGKETIGTSIYASAMYSRRNPLQRWFKGCIKEWDGKKRIQGDKSEIARAFMGDSADEKTSMFLQLFFLAGGQRIWTPGHTAQEMLVIEGPQGTFKSTWVRVLAPVKSVHLDSPLRWGDKEGLHPLVGKMLAEIPEMDIMVNGRSSEVVKAALSSPIDEFRPPYGAEVMEYPRTVVFVGTINPKGGWLRDVTGGRRFMPIRVNGPIDVRWFYKHRRQIWAEAGVMLQQGCRSYPNAEWTRAIMQEMELRTVQDGLGIMLDRELERYGLVFITTDDIMTVLMGVSIERADQLTIRKIDSAMTSLGWEYCRKWRSREDEGSGKERPHGWYDPQERHVVLGWNGFAPPKTGRYPTNTVKEGMRLVK